MKKIFLFVALCATITLSAENLPFKIAGVQATKENIETLLDEVKAKDNINVSGEISYEASSRILNLKQFVLNLTTTEDVPGLEIVENETLSIRLIGTNYIISDKSKAAGVKLNELSNLILMGSGNLHVNTHKAGQVGFLMGDYATMQVMYTTLEVFSENASSFVAEKGDAAKSIVLTISNSQVKATYRNDTEKGYAVENLNTLNIEFSDVEFIPNGNDEKLTAMRVSYIYEKMVNLAVENASEYVFSPEDKNYKHGTILARELKWGRDLKDDKNLIAIGTEMNDGLQKEYTWTSALAKGSAVLRNDTLFLKDAETVNYAGRPGLTIYKDKAITIHLEGENVVTPYDAIAGIFSYHGVTFVGNGSLRVGGYDAGIMVQKGVWVKGEPETPTIVAVGHEYGICNAQPEAYSGQWSLMIDKGADVTAIGQELALCLNNNNENKGLSLRYGIEIAKPYDPEFVFTVSEVRFATPEWKAYVQIAGRTINSFNYNHLAEMLHATKVDSKGEEPSIGYDKENACLSFDNVNISWHESKNTPFLKISEKLTIYARGENTVEMESSKEFIHAGRDVTISGNGPEGNKLIAYGISWGEMADKKPYSGTFAYLDGNVNLSFYNVTSAANYFEHAIVGSKDDTHKVYFNKASVGMFTSKENTQEITEMQFSECEIHKPTGATFSPELKGIALDGKLVAGDIVISTIEEGIDYVQMDNGQCTKVIRDGRLFFQMQDGTKYDVTGRKQ